jgi:hypothetical protein
MKAKSMFTMMMLGALAVMFMFLLDPVKMIQTSQAVQNQTKGWITAAASDDDFDDEDDDDYEDNPPITTQIPRGFMWFDLAGDGNISTQDCGDDISLMFIQHCLDQHNERWHNERDDDSTWTGLQNHTVLRLSRLEMAKRIIQTVNAAAKVEADYVLLHIGQKVWKVTAQIASDKVAWEYLMDHFPDWYATLKIVLMQLQREAGLPADVPFEYIR